MYQIHLRTHASKLAVFASNWRVGRIQRLAGTARKSAFGLRGALAGLARLAALRVIAGASTEIVEQHDSRDPRNW